MNAIRHIHEVSEDGVIKLNVPKTLGRKVEIIILSIPDDYQDLASEDANISKKMDDEEQFFALAAQAAIEDDPEEDAIWRKYLK